MGTIAFFPWMHLRERAHTSAFDLLRYRRGLEPLGQDSSQAQLDTLLEPYREAPGGRLGKATLLQLHGKSLLEDLSDDEIELVLRFGELVAFAGLAARRFFDQTGYSNRDNFRLIVQRFVDPGSGMLVISRRRDGSNWTAVTKSAMMVVKPHHVATAPWQSIDEPLLESLLQCTTHSIWRELEEGIVGFNAASTDSPDVREESEAVAIVGALERAFGLRGGDENELASAFIGGISPNESIKPDDCARVTTSPRRERFEKYSSLREVWVRDFYRLRGDHAHGKLAPHYTPMWGLREHLLIASLVFPLVVKSRLVGENVYEWSDSDRSQINALEGLLCQDHFQERKGDGSLVSPWSKTLEKEHMKVLVEKWYEIVKPVESEEGHEESDGDLALTDPVLDATTSREELPSDGARTEEVS